MKQILITTRTGMKIYSDPMSEIDAENFILNLGALRNHSFFGMSNALIHKEAVDTVVILPYNKDRHLTIVKDNNE